MTMGEWSRTLSEMILHLVSNLISLMITPAIVRAHVVKAAYLPCANSHFRIKLPLGGKRTIPYAVTFGCGQFHSCFQGCLCFSGAWLDSATD